MLKFFYQSESLKMKGSTHVCAKMYLWDQTLVVMGLDLCSIGRGFES